MARRTTHAEALSAWRGLSPDLLAGLPADGDVVKRFLLHPALLRMIGPVRRRAVLDVGCGTGEFARLLADGGARVSALEPSAALAAHTRAAAQRHRVPVDVVEADLLDIGPVALPEPGYDVVIASLVLCGIPDLRAGVDACLRALNPGGLLVIAVEHPCFEQSLRTWTRTGRAEITQYLSEYELPGSISPDFHRPLSTYVSTVLQAGCRIVGLDEPRVQPSTVADHPYLRPLLELPLFLLLGARGPVG